MGSEKRQDRTHLKCKAEGRDHSRWKKEALAANEGTVGGTEEIRREEVTVFRRRPAVGCIAWLRGAFMINSIVREEHQLRSCLFFRELLRDSQDFLGHPRGKWSDHQFVLAGRCVHFLNSGKPLLGKPAGQSDEGGPKTAMDVSNFPIH